MSKKKVQVLFIHHSTGGNLITQGEVRKLLNTKHADIDFFDHSYNLYPFFPKLLAQVTHHKGLTDESGHITGHDYNIVISNNSPKEYVEIFARAADDSTLKYILQYDVIAFKNCYPTTKIENENQLTKDKDYYNSIRENLKKYPNKLFILFTPPPLRAESTRPDYAERARKLSNWLASEEYLQGGKNIVVFDFFDLLASKHGTNRNMLKREYVRHISFDSHPNSKANIEVAKIFADFLIHTVDSKFSQK